MADKLIEEAEPRSCRRCLLGPGCHERHDRAAPNCVLSHGTAVSQFLCQTAEAARSTRETWDRPSAIKRKRLHSAAATQETESKKCCGEWNDLVIEFPTGERLQTPSMPLRMSSPVFDAMLTPGFRESKDKRIKVDVASFADFAAFCNMMRPGAWSASNVNEDNVEGLLSISDYYQVDFVKEACEARLLTMPLLPLPRLLQAQRYGLQKLFRHAVMHLAEKGKEAELRQLRISSPDAMLEVALQMRGLLRAKAKPQTPRQKLPSASPALPRRSLRLAAKSAATS
ncbi:bath-38 [Symbiodinium microadriaticum]|nr:bath-38 [Symbiodinium sp. KB8]CAE7441965.1 bath-38 [Symbiodinium microadriaticum]